MATLPDLPTFNLSPSTLLDIATDLVNQVRQAANDLVNHVSPQNATFENTLRPLADIDNELKGKVQYLALFQAVSPSSEMRNASSAAVNMVDKAYLGIFQTPSLCLGQRCLQKLRRYEKRRPKTSQHDSLYVYGKWA